jgi:hypothetical protein
VYVRWTVIDCLGLSRIKLWRYGSGILRYHSIANFCHVADGVDTGCGIADTIGNSVDSRAFAVGNNRVACDLVCLFNVILRWCIGLGDILKQNLLSIW